MRAFMFDGIIGLHVFARSVLVLRDEAIPNDEEIALGEEHRPRKDINVI
jgi:hypothetical protein